MRRGRLNPAVARRLADIGVPAAPEQVVTTVGATHGLDIVSRTLLQPGDAQAWLPWDTPEATRRFLQHHRPRCGLLMETEVWPALVQACQQQAVPLWLVNARLNDKSWRAAQRWSWLSGPAYRGLRAVLAQSPADAERLRSVGAQVTAVLGNLKFDVKPQPLAQARAQQWRAQWTLPRSAPRS
mgnify:CR=1 FL=1